jgi:hypothetical protein
MAAPQDQRPALPVDTTQHRLTRDGSTKRDLSLDRSEDAEH